MGALHPQPTGTERREEAAGPEGHPLSVSTPAQCQVRPPRTTRILCLTGKVRLASVFHSAAGATLGSTVPRLWVGAVGGPAPDEGTRTQSLGPRGLQGTSKWECSWGEGSGWRTQTWWAGCLPRELPSCPPSGLLEFRLSVGFQSRHSSWSRASMWVSPVSVNLPGALLPLLKPCLSPFHHPQICRTGMWRGSETLG